MSVRSVRLTIGRMPTAAAASMSTFAGKQNTESTPSRFRTSAIAALPFIGPLPRYRRRLAATMPSADLLILRAAEQAADGEPRGRRGAIPAGRVVALDRRRRAGALGSLELAGLGGPQ